MEPRRKSPTDDETATPLAVVSPEPEEDTTEAASKVEPAPEVESSPEVVTAPDAAAVNETVVRTEEVQPVATSPVESSPEVVSAPEVAAVNETAVQIEDKPVDVPVAASQEVVSDPDATVNETAVPTEKISSPESRPQASPSKPESAPEQASVNDIIASDPLLRALDLAREGRAISKECYELMKKRHLLAAESRRLELVLRQMERQYGLIRSASRCRSTLYYYEGSDSLITNRLKTAAYVAGIAGGVASWFDSWLSGTGSYLGTAFKMGAVTLGSFCLLVDYLNDFGAKGEHVHAVNLDLVDDLRRTIEKTDETIRSKAEEIASLDTKISMRP